MIREQSIVNLRKVLLQLLCLCTFIAAGLPTCAAGRGDWWTFHHDAQHTGRSPFTGPSTPTLEWKYATGFSISSSPAIAADGTIYVGSNDHYLYAVNPADGSLKWKYATGGAVVSSPAIGVDGTIYFGSCDANFYALNPADGSLKWQYMTGGGYIEASPAIGTDGTIYIGSCNANLYALNPADGSLKWKYAAGDGTTSAPALGTDGTIYFGAADDNLYALNPADGSLKWKYATGNQVDSAPVVGVDGTIYFGSVDDNLYALNPKDGSLKWKYTTGDWIEYASPALGADGTIYVGSDDYNFYALNPADGSVKWKYTTGNNITSSPAIDADGTIYIGSNDDNLYALNPGDGSLKWKYSIGGRVFSSPALGADGTIYVGSWDYNLYAIGAPMTFTVTPSAGTGGSISPSTAQKVIDGGSVTFTAIPNTGYTVNTWLVDGTDVQIGGTTYVLSNITANHTVQVTFSMLTYTITPMAGAYGTISPSAAQTVNYGSSLTFTATPSSGYMVNAWSVDGRVAQTGGATFTLKNITAGHTVLVTFMPIPPFTKVSLTVLPASPQPAGTPITLTAVPTGGGGAVQYLFRVGYTDTAGWHWTNINSTYTTTATCTWTPTVANTYTLVVWARIDGHTASYDLYASITYQVTAPPPLTKVTLTAQPVSPQFLNTPITLAAVPTGGGKVVEYLFRVGYTDTAGWHWTNINGNYTTTAICIWTPTVANTYTLVAWARLIGHTASYDQYASISYQVTAPPPLTKVALTTLPASPQFVNTPITLTAVPTGGGGQVQYLFRVGYTNATGWVWTNLNPTYTTTPTCTWTPATAGTYTLVVWARLLGHTASYDQYASLTDQVTFVPPLTAVTLSTKPTSPQPVNTPITLTATPTGGGGQVQYMFRVGYTNATGWVWTNLNSSYTSTTTCTWTPVAVGSYTLVVWARLVGHTANYDQYQASTYQITPTN